MHINRLATLLAITAAFAVPACSGGDDGGGGGTDSNSDGSTGSSDSDSATTGSTNPTTSSGATDSATSGGTTNTTDTTATTGATDSASDTGTDSATSITSSGGTAGACTSWVVTYDLKGSKYVIDALVDFTINVQEPYTDDLNTGPGTMKIRFTDDGGAPGSGTAQIVDYSMVYDFVTGSLGTNVTTDIDTKSGPDACGTASGTFDGTTLTWDSPKEMNPFCRDGSVSCTGSFCGQQGAPPENMPFVFNNDCSEPLAISDFTFSNGTDSFTMPMTDVGGGTSWMFVGTAVSTEEDMGTPECACP